MNRLKEIPKLKVREVALAVVGMLLCAAGYLLAHADAKGPRTVMATAAGCNMPTDIYEPRSGEPAGSVVLLHGLSANKRVMAFTAQEFANLNLRVFVPDLPGHGKTRGPFSPERAQSCAAALLRDLTARKAVLPERTILAGHSMGGAIAVRVAAQIPVAGVIAISPAPMQPSPAVSSELLLFASHPPLPQHSLVLSASVEPGAIRQIAEKLTTDPPNPSSKYEVIPNASHVSILFDLATFGAIRAWSAQILGTPRDADLPRSRPASGCLLGILGLALLTPPFLREITSTESDARAVERVTPGSVIQTFAVILALAFFSALLLKLGLPFRFIGLFQGGYFISLLFLVGVAMLLVQRPSLDSIRLFLKPSSAAVAAAFLLILLFGAWLELTFYEAWLTPARWLRFPVLFLAVLPWHLAEEVFLGPAVRSPDYRRLLLAIAARSLIWLTAIAAVFYLHSGQFIFVLLPVYFLLFSILQRLAMDTIRHRTRTMAAAAIFGAILLAGFVLAILPVA